MIYKVFYQETKDRNPKREQTRKIFGRISNGIASLFKNDTVV